MIQRSNGSSTERSAVGDVIGTAAAAATSATDTATGLLSNEKKRKEEEEEEEEAVRRKKRRRRQHRLFFSPGELPIVLLIAVVVLCIVFVCLVSPPDHLKSEHELPGMMRSSSGSSNSNSNSNNDKKDEAPFYHIVFSSSCSPQQHWESYVLFYHAWKVGQRGNITRILSGCNDKEVKEQTEFFREHISTKLSNRFHLHFTPDYSKFTSQGKNVFYKYMNKPMGLSHWFQHFLRYNGSNPTYDDHIVFLIDPDQILLKPLVHDFRNDPSIIFVNTTIANNHSNRYVHHGNPIAQQDAYLHNKWMRLNLTAITADPNTPAANRPFWHGPNYFNTGPPYLATAKDMYAIALKWADFAPLVHQQFPKLFAEMFGFVIATAHMNMPFALVQSLVVSTTMTNNREGWPLIDAINGTVCPTLDQFNPLRLPYILHYCKRYLLGHTFWSKYRLRKDFLGCDPPLLEEPHATLPFDHTWWVAPPAHGKKPGDYNHTPTHVSKLVAKREAFMLCGMIPKVNEAVSYYKRNACARGKANFSKVYNFFNTP